LKIKIESSTLFPPEVVWGLICAYSIGLVPHPKDISSYLLAPGLNKDTALENFFSVHDNPGLAALTVLPSQKMGLFITVLLPVLLKQSKVWQLFFKSIFTNLSSK